MKQEKFSININNPTLNHNNNNRQISQMKKTLSIIDNNNQKVNVSKIFRNPSSKENYGNNKGISYF